MELLYKSLSDCVVFLSGGTPPKSNYSLWSGELPWVSSGEMAQPKIFDTALHITHQAGKEHSKIVPKHTILVVVRGMSLANEFRVALTQREMAFNQDLKALIPREGINSLYIFYSLYGRRFEINKLASESAHGTKKLDTKVLESLPVILPPLPAQKKIVAILSAYDDLIENNRRRIALLEKMAEEIYREWFVRLRFPGYEQVKFYKGVPEGWEIAQLGDVVKDIIDYRGVTPKKLNSDWQSEGIIALSALNVKKGKLIRLEDAKRVSEPLFERWMRKKLDRLDILLTSEAPLGEVYILMEKEKFVLSQRLFAIRANPKKIEPVYLYHYLFCEVGQYELTSKATGSTVGGIRQALLRQIEILIPDNTVQKKFSAIAQPILEKIHKLWKRNNLLEQTRDRLLTRLISGRLSVEDLDIQFPPSMAEKRLS